MSKENISSYNKIEDVKRQILDFLAKHPEESFKSKELARLLKLNSEENYSGFKRAIHELKESGKIMRVKGKRYCHLCVEEKLTGRLVLDSRGSGIVKVEGSEEEIFIKHENIAEAMHNDIVEVMVQSRRTQSGLAKTRREGRIIRVVSKGDRTFVGTLERARKKFFVVPVGKNFLKEVIISGDNLLNAREGDRVVVELTSAPTFYGSATGRVVEILGKAGELSTEIKSVVKEYNLSTSFPRDVIIEAKAIPREISEDEIKRRADFRNVLCFTIDPEDAKDFDDAVSLEILPDGNYRLGVHIADVSYYVKSGSAIDKEALKRGTSVYFPNGFIPMLPEVLSSDICSLKPEEDRLTFSVLINISPRGIVKNYEIVESIIRSKRRFSYEYVQSLLNNIENNRLIQSEDRIFAETLWNMYSLSRVLTEKRLKEGSIDFDSAEVKFEFDKEGKPIRITKKERLGSHRLIEEFMLLANRIIARHIGVPKREEQSKPFLYRVHDSPDPDRIRELAMFVEKLGFKLNVDGGVSSKALQKLLDQVKGTEVENIVNDIVLRSMAKAVYSERNIGHYGLAFDYYAHFTSPIRRYPDLVVHRILKKYAEGISQREREEIRQRLPYIAKQSSEMERIAMEAERTATKVMQVEFMKRHLGEEFNGIVSGVTNYGIFVELTDSLVEGMVHVKDLDDDYYTYDVKQYALKGRHTGKQYRLGDKVKVQLIRVNPEERQVDFVVVSDESEANRSRRRRRG